ncbi:hypothetical protein AYI69_g1028 [Smittium culicis]|uniref:Uncharacterized protein n=1 Tax=Smittium culicis TaxID=133412 RepID=A0A1R1YRI2_9FUNG|nr:hypothetical protein AYI69_g1028 [Smittium culicis]
MPTSSNSSLENSPPIYGDNYLEDEFISTRLPDSSTELTVPSSRNIAENQEGLIIELLSPTADVYGSPIEYRTEYTKANPNPETLCLFQKRDYFFVQNYSL